MFPERVELPVLYSGEEIGMVTALPQLHHDVQDNSATSTTTASRAVHHIDVSQKYVPVNFLLLARQPWHPVLRMEKFQLVQSSSGSGSRRSSHRGFDTKLVFLRYSRDCPKHPARKKHYQVQFTPARFISSWYGSIRLPACHVHLRCQTPARQSLPRPGSQIHHGSASYLHRD